MVDYQPIAELVKRIPADTWKILQEIQKRRPAMMLDDTGRLSGEPLSTPETETSCFYF